MTNDRDNSQRTTGAVGERTYYTFATDFSQKAAPLAIWVNEKEQFKGYGPDAKSSQPFCGVKLTEPPRIRFEFQGRRRTLRDAYSVTLGIWLVSDRLKALFERLDPDPAAFAFLAAAVDYSNFAEPGPGFWFCYFMRELDCVDEEHSDIEYPRWSVQRTPSGSNMRRRS